MADKKISALTSLAQADIATATDVLPIVDTSATETKKATPAAIVGAAAAAGLTNVDINSGAIDGTTVGASSASSGAFTTLSATGALTVDGNATLGNASADAVTVNGYMGVGGAGNAGQGLRLTSNALTGTSQYGAFLVPVGTSSGTTAVYGLAIAAGTAASAYTANLVRQIYTGDAVKGAGSNITSLQGIYVDDLTAGTNNYGITSAVSSGSNKWNIYASGTANNYFAGNVGIGTSSPGAKLDVNGSINIASTQNLQWGSSALAIAGASNILTFYTNSAERARITAAGELLVGGTSTLPALSGGITVDCQLGVQSVSGGYIGVFRNDTSVLTGNTIGGLIAYGNDTTTNTVTPLTYILSAASGDHAAGDNPTDITFGTTADNTSTVREVARITQAGNVGIGTSSPTAKLDIVDGVFSVANTATSVDNTIRNLTATGTTGETTGISFDVANNVNGVRIYAQRDGTYGSAATRIASFRVATTTGGVESEKFAITGEGNVGIGTSSPAEKLSVSGAILVSGGANSFNYDGLVIDRASTTSRIASGATSGGSELTFWTASSGGNEAERLRIDSSGNVGIGTTNPQGRLDLGDGTSAKAITWGGSTGTAKYSTIWTEYSSGSLILGAGVEGNTSAANFLYSYTGTIGTSAIELDSFGSDGIKFYTDSAAARTAGTVATMSERMRISQSGNVGIGTTSPLSKLHLSGAATADARLTFTQTTAGLSSQIQQGTTGMAISALGSQAILLETNGTERARITSAGELLVGGTTSIAANSGAISIQRVDGDPSLRFFRDDTTITTGNGLGTISWYGNDTTSNAVTLHAYIEAVASDVHGAGDNPTDIRFATTPDGTATTAEAGRITQSGSYVLKGGTTTAAAGVGIIFPATQVASANANSLDDYEEGTWTPVVADAASAGNASATVLYGNYTKIGNIVTVTAACVNINTSGLTAGNVAYIRGLPFASADIAAATGYFTGSAFTSAVTISAPPTVVLGDNGQTALNLNDGSAILVSDLTSGSADIWFTLTYQA